MRLGTGLQREGWAHLDLNQGPISYEPTALTAELWALAEGIISYLMRTGKGGFLLFSALNVVKVPVNSPYNVYKVT